MREYCQPFNYAKEDHNHSIGIWRISVLQQKFSQLAVTSLALEITC